MSQLDHTPRSANQLEACSDLGMLSAISILENDT